MLYKFGYKLDEISSIFNTLQFTTLVLYSVQCTIIRNVNYTLMDLVTFSLTQIGLITFSLTHCCKQFTACI